MSTFSRSALASTLVLAGLAAQPVWAHTGAGAVHGFAAGFAHPFTGLDHLLAMVAVGLWAGLAGGRAAWAWPAAFVGAMLAGIAIGMSGPILPAVELGIGASVVLLGLAAAFRIPASVAIGAMACGIFALLHC